MSGTLKLTTQFWSETCRLCTDKWLLSQFRYLIEQIFFTIQVINGAITRDRNLKIWKASLNFMVAFSIPEGYFDHSRMEVIDEAMETLIEEKRHSYTRNPHWSHGTIIPWALAAFFFCTTCISLFSSSTNTLLSRSSHNYEDGFATDFGMSCSLPRIYLMLIRLVAIKPGVPIKIIQKKFTNDLLFNSTSQSLYNEPLDPNETTYVGAPSPAIDLAWKKLLHAQYIALEDSESEQIPPDHRTPIWYNGEHNFMELSVFHNLHCLNEIRTALDHDHGNDDQEDWMHKGRAHLDHCVDQIRQALMCHSDLTPVPMSHVEGAPDGAVLGNGELHTCRDFDAIWAWVEERGKKMKALGD